MKINTISNRITLLEERYGDKIEILIKDEWVKCTDTFLKKGKFYKTNSRIEEREIKFFVITIHYLGLTDVEIYDNELEFLLKNKDK